MTRYYDHFIQRTFSHEMTRPIMPITKGEETGKETEQNNGKVIPMRKAQE